MSRTAGLVCLLLGLALGCGSKASHADCEKLAEHVISLAQPRATRADLVDRCEAELGAADVQCGLAATSKDELRKCRR